MTDERDDEPKFTRNPFETDTALLVAAVLAAACLLGAAVVVVRAIAGWIVGG